MMRASRGPECTPIISLMPYGIHDIYIAAISMLLRFSGGFVVKKSMRNLKGRVGRLYTAIQQS
jgi:hypothetical protein